ncbi:MAG: hypothetical protein K2L87_04680 [Clostridiales bacterium]|nr:hypothetical protein [Clostridiales bacterium]
MIELRLLQQYLELAMWKTNAESGRDSCGKYPRCAYCNKHQEFACAKAFLACMRAGRDGIVPAGGYPEPPAKEFFGDALIEKRPNTSVTEGVQTVYSMNSLYAQQITSMRFWEAYSEVTGADTKTPRQITSGVAESAPTPAKPQETAARRSTGGRVLNVRSGFEGDRTPIATLKRK